MKQSCERWPNTGDPSAPRMMKSFNCCDPDTSWRQPSVQRRISRFSTSFGASLVRALLDGSSGEIRELEFLDLQIMASKAGTGLVWPPEDPMLEQLESRLKARTIEWSNLFRGIIVKLDNLR